MTRLYGFKTVATRVCEHHEKDTTGVHDWPHIARVRHLAHQIAWREGADLGVVDLAALLHDLDDWKQPSCDGTPVRARNLLLNVDCFDGATIQHVLDIIPRVSFKGAAIPDDMPSLEGKCVMDADRLDAMGAVGVARCFAYGGSKGRALFTDAGILGQHHATAEAYQGSQSGSFNHFYEKLLLLKDRMQTKTGLALAGPRHAFLETFADQFLTDWHSAERAQLLEPACV